MSSRKQGTIITPAKIDVSPDGIKISFESIDADLANLIADAGDYTANPAEFTTYDSSDVVMVSKRKLAFVDKPIVPDTIE